MVHLSKVEDIASGTHLRNSDPQIKWNKMSVQCEYKLFDRR